MPLEDVAQLLTFFKDFVEKNPQTCRTILLEQENLTRALALAQARVGMFKLSSEDDALDDLEAEEMMVPMVKPGDNSIGLQGLDPEQQEVLSQVKEMTPQLLATLPPEQQTQIRALRQALGLKPI